jgi:AcrR family transcriptional regulator
MESGISLWVSQWAARQPDMVLLSFEDQRPTLLGVEQRSDRGRAEVTAARPRRKAPGRQRVEVAPERFEEILDISAQIFLEQGYAGTTMRDIAERVGMLNGSLYYYIDSKEDLLFRVVERAYAVFSANLEAVESFEGDIVQKLYALVYAHVTGSAEHYIVSSVYTQDFRILPVARQRKIVEFRDRHDEVFRSLLRDGQDEGVILAHLDIRLASIAILTMVSNVHRWYRPGGGWTPDYVARGYAEIALRGLFRDPRRIPTGKRADQVIERYRAALDAVRVRTTPPPGGVPSTRGETRDGS